MEFDVFWLVSHHDLNVFPARNSSITALCYTGTVESHSLKRPQVANDF